MTIDVRGIAHVGVATDDVPGAIEDYRRLGFELESIEELEGQHIRSHILSVANGAVKIEVLESLDPSSTVARFLSKNGEGLHHLCLEVDSLEGVLGELSSTDQRAGLVSDTPSTDEAGRRVFVHPQTMHGTMIGLVEPHR